jgi:hypothetical protein
VKPVTWTITNEPNAIRRVNRPGFVGGLIP